MATIINLIRSMILWLVFFIGVVFIAVISAILGLFKIRNERLIQYLIKLFSNLCLVLSFTYVKIIGKENIQKDTGFVIAANHNNFLDNLILLGKLPFLFKIVVASPGFSIPFIRQMYIGAGYIKADVAMNYADAIDLINNLKRGEKVLIYSVPSEKNETGKFTEALVSFSLKTKTPILPVYIKDSVKTMGMGKFMLQGNHVSLIIGGPINNPSLETLYEKMKLMQDF